MDTVGSPWLWAGFLAFVLAVLAFDLGVLNRKDHVVGPREALGWSAFWIAVSLAFGALVWGLFGEDRGQQYLLGYVIEKALSVDNLFVFVALFGALRIPRQFQHRVLYWGILSALVLRAGMIFGGVALLSRFHALMYVFGAFLVIAAVRLWRHRQDGGAPGGSGAVRLARRLLPTTERFQGHAFTMVEGGRRVATPLLLALIAVELSDVLFAVDSVPAVLAVTQDPFIVFTSNIFAILGLRSLYFVLADAVDRFVHLRPALSAILLFVGAKMLAADLVQVPPALSLGVICAVLAVAIGASVWRDRRSRAGAPASDRATTPP